MTDPTRRTVLQSAVAAGAAAALPGVAVGEPFRPQGRVKHSVVFWCFNAAGEKWDADTTCRIARELGCVSVEIIEQEHWPTLKKHGLTCAIAPNGMPKTPFMYGFNNPRYAPEVLDRMTKRVGECKDAGVPSVIAFTGYQWTNADDPRSGEITRD